MYKCKDCLTEQETQHSSSGSALFWALEHCKKQLDDVGITELEDTDIHVYSLSDDEVYYIIEHIR